MDEDDQISQTGNNTLELMESTPIVSQRINHATMLNLLDSRYLVFLIFSYLDCCHKACIRLSLLNRKFAAITREKLEANDALKMMKRVSKNISDRTEASNVKFEHVNLNYYQNLSLSTSA